MSANHHRTVLDDIDDLKRRMRELRAQLALPSQRLDSQTLTAAGPITLTVPPGSSYSALRVIWRARGDTSGAAIDFVMQLNGDTASHYLWQINQANGATASPANSGALVAFIQIGTIPAATAGASFFGTGETVVASPASTTAYKACSGHSNAVTSTTMGFAGTYGGLWESMAAISTITVKAKSGNLVAGSTATLYGI